MEMITQYEPYGQRKSNSGDGSGRELMSKD